MEKFNEMKQNEQFWSWADSAARGEQAMRLSIMDAKDAGKEIGKETGIRELLLKLINKKYCTDAKEWLETLNEKQLFDLSDLILDYDSFQELQDAFDSDN